MEKEKEKEFITKLLAASRAIEINGLPKATYVQFPADNINEIALELNITKDEAVVYLQNYFNSLP